MSRTLPVQVHLKFSDVAVSFSEEEWRHLGQRQQEMYKDVMTENYENLLSLGLNIAKPDLFHEIEQWEKPPGQCAREHEAPSAAVQTGTLSAKPDILREIERLDKLSVKDTKEYLLSRGGLSNLSHFQWKPEPQNKSEDETLIRQKFIGPLPQKCVKCNGIYNCYCNISKRSSKKNFHCIDCGKGYRLESKLLLHQRSHLQEGPYKCSLCEKRFRKPQHLVKHQRTHLVTEYKCEKCQVTFYNRTEFFQHKKTHQKRREFKCFKCGALFPNLLELASHRKGHKKVHECALCNETFRNKVDFVSHQREHSRDQIYKCNKCLKVYRRLSCLLKHLTAHSVQRPSSNKPHDGESKIRLGVTDKPGADGKRSSVQAKTEQKPSKDAIVMSGPTPNKNSEEPPNCNLLLKANTQMGPDRKPALWKRPPPVRHINSIESERLFRCKKCRSHFRHHESLMRHRKSHLTVFICHECGQMFKKLIQLFIHRFQHQTNRPYQCRHCAKSFSLKSLLHLHQTTHEAWKPSADGHSSTNQRQKPHTDVSAGWLHYSCSHCKENFQSPSSLLLHQKSHPCKITNSPESRGPQVSDIRTSPLSYDVILWKRPIQQMVTCKDYVKRVCPKPSDSKPNI